VTFLFADWFASRQAGNTTPHMRLVRERTTRHETSKR